MVYRINPDIVAARRDQPAFSAGFGPYPHSVSFDGGLGDPAKSIHITEGGAPVEREWATRASMFEQYKLDGTMLVPPLPFGQ